MKSKKVMTPIIIVVFILILVMLLDWIRYNKYTKEYQLWNNCKQAEILNPVEDSGTKGRLKFNQDELRNLKCGDKPVKPIRLL